MSTIISNGDSSNKISHKKISHRKGAIQDILIKIDHKISEKIEN